MSKDEKHKACPEASSNEAQPARDEQPAADAASPSADRPREPDEASGDAPAGEGAVVAAEEVEALRAQLAEEHDRYLRALAELENVRRRSREEQARMLEYANEQLLAELLAVADDLERALAMPDASADALRRGVQMIYNKLMSIMQRFGAEPMEVVGQPFDPYYHEAVETVPTDEAEEDTIIEELQRGYKYKGRLLRPARVRVATRQQGDDASA